MIRPAGIDDAGRLALAGAATFLDAFAGMLDGADIVAHCAREHTEVAYTRALAGGMLAWLAELRRAPIGYALLGAPSLPVALEPSDTELKRIYVMRRCQGSGVGSALLARAVEASRAVGKRRLLLGVYEGNARALAFYARWGFRQVGTRRFLVGHREHDDLILGLDLEPPATRTICNE